LPAKLGTHIQGGKGLPTYGGRGRNDDQGLMRGISGLAMLRPFVLLAGDSAAAQTTGQTANPGTGEDAPKPAQHEMSLEAMSENLDNASS